SRPTWRTPAWGHRSGGLDGHLRDIRVKAVPSRRHPLLASVHPLPVDPDPRMNPARHLVLVGPMGAGKTSIGRCLAQHFGLAFIDSDQEIERRTGATIPTVFECEGERGFRARERGVIREIIAGPPAVIATGGGAVLDPGNRGLL